jgi:DNA-binding NtrC family response regulator
VDTGPSGCRLSVYLPRGETAPQPAPAPPPITTAAAAPPLPPESPATLETVLVVDDEPGIRSLIAKVLSRQGYRILEASSAEEAVTVAARHPGAIPITVTDIVLPGKNGRELVDELRLARPDLRALFISGYTDDAAIYSGTLPPGTGFLQKPFALPALISTVRAVLDTPLENAATL